MLNRTARYLLAAIQAIIGWEWIMSGCNKILSGNFPQGLSDALNNGIKDNPNGWYVAFLKQIVLPNSMFFGYMIQWTEIAVGIILLSAAVLLLTKPRMAGEPQHRLAIAYSIMAIIAAAVGAFQNINFHFWMGGWVIPTFDPASAYNEGIDLDGLLPLFFLIIIIANLGLIQELTGKKWFKRSSRPAPAISEEKVMA